MATSVVCIQKDEGGKATDEHSVLYSWFKPNDVTKSRIDFWFISVPISQEVFCCSMSAAPAHSVLKTIFTPPEFNGRNKGYWKFNSHLLNNKTYCDGVKYLIAEVVTKCSLTSYVAKWEGFFFNSKFRDFLFNLVNLITRVTDKLS